MMSGVPHYVHTAGVGALVALTLLFVVPVPRWARRCAAGACRILLFLGLGALAMSALLPAFGVWYPAIVVAMSALTMWFVMFWFAREHPSAESEESQRDEGTDDGGGGGQPPPPPPPQRPSGGIDWDEFDRQRTDWERTPDRDRDPVLV